MKERFGRDRRHRCLSMRGAVSMSPFTAADPGLVDLFAQLHGGVLITLKRDGRPQASRKSLIVRSHDT